MQRSLEEYLKVEYPFNVVADPDGGYVIVYPDLPGCLSVADNVEEIGLLAEDARRGWIASMYEQGNEIPLPSYPEQYSGKFNVRLPRSLHRSLVEMAEREGVSLNTHVIALLERGNAREGHDDELLRRVEALQRERRDLQELIAEIQESTSYRRSEAS